MQNSQWGTIFGPVNVMTWALFNVQGSRVLNVRWDPRPSPIANLIQLYMFEIHILPEKEWVCKLARTPYIKRAWFTILLNKPCYFEFITLATLRYPLYKPSLIYDSLKQALLFRIYHTKMGFSSHSAKARFLVSST